MQDNVGFNFQEYENAPCLMRSAFMPTSQPYSEVSTFTLGPIVVAIAIDLT